MVGEPYSFCWKFSRAIALIQNEFLCLNGWDSERKEVQSNLSQLYSDRLALWTKLIRYMHTDRIIIHRTFSHNETRMAMWGWINSRVFFALRRKLDSAALTTSGDRSLNVICMLIYQKYNILEKNLKGRISLFFKSSSKKSVHQIIKLLELWNNSRSLIRNWKRITKLRATKIKLFLSSEQLERIVFTPRVFSRRNGMKSDLHLNL